MTVAESRTQKLTARGGRNSGACDDDDIFLMAKSLNQ